MSENKTFFFFPCNLFPWYILPNVIASNTAETLQEKKAPRIVNVSGSRKY